MYTNFWLLVRRLHVLGHESTHDVPGLYLGLPRADACCGHVGHSNSPAMTVCREYSGNSMGGTLTPLLFRLPCDIIEECLSVLQTIVLYVLIPQSSESLYCISTLPFIATAMPASSFLRIALHPLLSAWYVSRTCPLILLSRLM